MSILRSLCWHPSGTESNSTLASPAYLLPGIELGRISLNDVLT
jgi:hypothetical protein